MVWLADARTPHGMRLYALGDVHGCTDQLRELHDRIASDLDARPIDDWRIIHLGDYVDRGPDSRGTIDFLIERQAEDRRVLCLRGNHEKLFARGLEGGRMRELWLRFGGDETLQSYGVALPDFLRSYGAEGSAEGIIPNEHRIFLESLPDEFRAGDYFFVHAGIDPELPLSEQNVEAKLWIRAPFLESDQEFEAIIIHGHTPGPKVEVRANRIGIDTGAVLGGELSCLVLEGGQKALLTPDGPAPLPEISGGQGASRRSRHPIAALFRRIRGRG